MSSESEKEVHVDIVPETWYEPDTRHKNPFVRSWWLDYLSRNPTISVHYKILSRFGTLIGKYEPTDAPREITLSSHHSPFDTRPVIVMESQE